MAGSRSVAQAFPAQLRILSDGQQSIQRLSKVILDQADYSQQMATLWLQELVREPVKKLKFIYLVNDVLLNTRKKYQQLVAAFAEVLSPAMADVGRSCSNEASVSFRLPLLFVRINMCPLRYTFVDTFTQISRKVVIVRF